MLLLYGFMNIESRLPTKNELLSEFFAHWHSPSPRTEKIKTGDSCGRVLAKDFFALCDNPVFRSSMMDGVAVKSSEFTAGAPDASLWKIDVDYVFTDTGDDFPDEFDAVIRIEDVEILPNGGLRLSDNLKTVKSGTLVNPKGKNLTKGALVGRKGDILTPGGLAALAMGAVSEVEVCAKPRVVFVPTGSELIPLGSLPARGKTMDANSVMAKALLEQMGAEAIIYPIAKDDRETLSKMLDKALSEADAVILNAGSSKGVEDYNYTLLEERGEFFIHGVAALPGKPLAMAVIDGKPVINVAGPPVSCFNGLDWCTRAIVRRLLGLPELVRAKVDAALTAPIIHKTGARYESIIRLNVELSDGNYTATPVPHWTESPADVLRTNGLYVTKFPPEQTEAGNVIEVELL